MHPNHSEFLKYLLKNKYYDEYYKYGGFPHCEYYQKAEDTVDMGQKQSIDKYSTEEILFDFLNNF
jgi:hypothetical protein